MRGGNVITLAAYRNDKELTVLQLDGTLTGSAVAMQRVDDVQAVGLATTPAGLHFLSRREGGTKVELHRFTIDGARVDVLPRISALRFRQLRFLGDGGPTMYLIGEKDDFSLQAWSITLPNTAS